MPDARVVPPPRAPATQRTSRALWLLNRGVLPPLPDLEPLVTLPARDSPHLCVPAGV